MRERLQKLYRRLVTGGPCECQAPRPITWYEVPAGRDDADHDPGPPPVCRKCGRRLPISFIEVVLPAREVTCD